MPEWTASEIPSQTGRLAIVTGIRGLGLETALALAKAGGEIILAGRNMEAGEDAIAKIRAEMPSANAKFKLLDLASLRSIADFAASIFLESDRLDLLINNAGVMRPPKRLETEDGFELQFGTNYLGHFALTAHLMPLLRRGTDARVVSLSSIAARAGLIDFEDLQAEQRYNSMLAYAQSKLACLMFAFELQRRSQAQEWGVASIAAHPGLSRTNLLLSAPGRSRFSGAGIMRTLLGFLFQPAPRGALPTLFAATAPGAKPGAYYGPNRMSEMRGDPALSRVPPRARDLDTAARLWRVSEQLTGVTFRDGGVKDDRAL